MKQIKPLQQFIFINDIQNATKITNHYNNKKINVRKREKKIAGSLIVFK